MKWVFAVVTIVAITLSVICVITKPNDEHHGVVASLVWATDGNPARQEQMELFKQWHRQHYGQPIDIQIDPTNSGREKVVIQSISGAGPDLFDYGGHPELERYVKSGVILDVTDRANTHGFSANRVWKGMRSSIIYNGRQYGFTDNVANYLMLYHKKVFDAAHLPYPKSGWTWHDFLKVAQKLSYREKNGIRHFAMASYDPMLMIYSNGGKMFTPNGTECIMNSPEAVSAMQFYRDLQNRYHVIPTASELSDQASAGGWGSGEINIFGAKGPKYFAMAYGGRFWYVQFAKMEREEPDGASLFDLGVVKAPIFKYDYTIGYGRCTGVNRNSKNREYALRFLEFLASPEFNRQINRSYDSLSGVQKYCKAPWTLSDNQPAPKGLESVNDPLWVTSMAYDYDYEESPFIPPYKVQQYWAEEFGKLSASSNESAEEMLDAFTKDVNDEIQRNVAFDPKLAQVYAVNKRKDEAGKHSE